MIALYSKLYKAHFKSLCLWVFLMICCQHITAAQNISGEKVIVGKESITIINFPDKVLNINFSDEDAYEYYIPKRREEKSVSLQFNKEKDSGPSTSLLINEGGRSHMFLIVYDPKYNINDNSRPPLWYDHSSLKELKAFVQKQKTIQSAGDEQAQAKAEKALEEQERKQREQEQSLAMKKREQEAADKASLVAKQNKEAAAKQKENDALLAKAKKEAADKEAALKAAEQKELAAKKAADAQAKRDAEAVAKQKAADEKARKEAEALAKAAREADEKAKKDAALLAKQKAAEADARKKAEALAKAAEAEAQAKKKADLLAKQKEAAAQAKREADALAQQQAAEAKAAKEAEALAKAAKAAADKRLLQEEKIARQQAADTLKKRKALEELAKKTAEREAAKERLAKLEAERKQRDADKAYTDLGLWQRYGSKGIHVTDFPRGQMNHINADFYLAKDTLWNFENAQALIRTGQSNLKIAAADPINKKVDITLENIAFKGAHTYYKLKVENHTDEDFLMGTTYLFWYDKNNKAKMEIKCSYLTYVSYFPLVRPHTTQYVVFATRSANILKEESLVLFVEERRAEKGKTNIVITGTDYHKILGKIEDPLSELKGNKKSPETNKKKNRKAAKDE